MMNLYDTLKMATDLTRDDGRVACVWKSGPQELLVAPMDGKAVLVHRVGGKDRPALVIGKKKLMRGGYDFTLTEQQFLQWERSWNPLNHVREEKGETTVKNENGGKSIRELALGAIANVPGWALESTFGLWDNGKSGKDREAIYVTRSKQTLLLVWQRGRDMVTAPCGLFDQNDNWVPTLSEERYKNWTDRVRKFKSGGKTKGQVKREERADKIADKDINVLSAISHAQWHSVHATVRSQSTRGKYMVYLRYLDGAYNAGQCTCPDNENGNTCKHLLAVRRFVKKG
jgi:hypothetical protein